MNNKNINQTNFEDLKRLVSTNFKQIIGDLNQFISDSSTAPFDSSNMHLIIEDEKSLEYIFSYSFSTRAVSELFILLNSKNEFKHFFSELKKANLFDIEKNILNPHLTIFGSFVRIFIQNLTKINNLSNYKRFLPFKFDNNLYEKCWSQYEKWISSKPITLKYYYLINNLEIEGKSFCFNKELGLKYKIPSHEEKENLVEEMKLFPSPFEGTSICIQRMTTIASCNSWIEGQVEIFPEDLVKGIGFVDKDIIDPYYIEEVLNLLGFTDSIVGFLVLNNPLSPLKITMQPQFERNKVYLLASHFFQYPDWLEKSFTFPRNKLNLNQDVMILLKQYPLLRKKYDSDSLLKLSVARLIKAQNSKSIQEIFLEIAIGIESLIVEGEGSPSLQFRLNTSNLIGKNYEDKKLIEKFCQILYDIRSVIVHEGGKKSAIKKKTNNKIGGLQLTVDLVRILFRLVLLRMISIENGELVLYTRDELLNIVKPARLGKNNEIKESKIFAKLYDNFIGLLKTRTVIGNLNLRE